jgi:hypothetical protein
MISAKTEPIIHLKPSVAGGRKTTTNNSSKIISEFLSTRTLLHRKALEEQRGRSHEFSDVTVAAEGVGCDSVGASRCRQLEARRKL